MAERAIDFSDTTWQQVQYNKSDSFARVHWNKARSEISIGFNLDPKRWKATASIASRHPDIINERNLCDCWMPPIRSHAADGTFADPITRLGGKL